MVGEVGLEPTKAKPADLQSAPFAARDTPPHVFQAIHHALPAQEFPWAVLMVTASGSVNRKCGDETDSGKLPRPGASDMNPA